MDITDKDLPTITNFGSIITDENNKIIISGFHFEQYEETKNISVFHARVIAIIYELAKAARLDILVKVKTYPYKQN